MIERLQYTTVSSTGKYGFQMLDDEGSVVLIQK